MKTALEWLEERYYQMDCELSYEDFEQVKEMEKQQKHKIIDEQVQILTDTLEEMMTGFDSEEDRMDFILDICNGYKKRLNQ